MASAGNGNVPHVAAELFKLIIGVNLLHVPYRGEASALTNLLAGQVHVYFASLPGSIEHIKMGRVRALAMTTASRSMHCR